MEALNLSQRSNCKSTVYCTPQSVQEMAVVHVHHSEQGNSARHLTYELEQTPDSSKDLMETLPPEVYLHILLRLDMQSLASASQTCKQWNSTIEDTDWLWRQFCHLQYDEWSMKEILRDRGIGYTWKESFIRNCGPHAIKRKWMEGVFSTLDMYDKYLRPFMCCMDVETWGQIFELELSR